MENTPDSDLQKLRDEAAAEALNAAHLSLHLHSLKASCEAFVRGVSGTTWKTTEPRIIGFKLEFDQMVSALAQPEPKRLTAEHIAALREAKVIPA
jgi:hypothetical protein